VQGDADASKATAKKLLEGVCFRPQAAANSPEQATLKSKDGMACKLLVLLQQCLDSCHDGQASPNVSLPPHFCCSQHGLILSGHTAVHNH
jgi:hypothetical protein